MNKPENDLSSIWSNAEWEKHLEELIKYRDLGLPGLDTMANFFAAVIKETIVNFPSVKLRRELVKIRRDRYVIKDTGIVKLIVHQRLKWILFRFWLYALMKAMANYINTNFKATDGKYNNIILEKHYFLHALMFMYQNLDSISSVTNNSNDNKVVRSSVVGSPKLLIEPYIDAINVYEGYYKNLKEQIKMVEILTQKKDITEDEFVEVLLGFDIKRLEKIVFFEILEDIHITKMYKGQQSIRYKAGLLVGLFKITHPNHFFDTDTSNGLSEKELNISSVLKIIG